MEASLLVYKASRLGGCGVEEGALPTQDFSTYAEDTCSAYCVRKSILGLKQYFQYIVSSLGTKWMEPQHHQPLVNCQ